MLFLSLIGSDPKTGRGSIINGCVHLVGCLKVFIFYNCEIILKIGILQKLHE